MTDAPLRVQSDAAEVAPDVEPIHPEAQALNDAQDRRLAEEARISDENMRARREFERHLERAHDIDIRQLQGEIRDLQSALESSGPIRVAWLQITHQVPAQPHRHLDGLHSMLGMCQDYRAHDLQAFEERLKAETPSGQVEIEGQAAMGGRQEVTKEQAAERIKFLEDNYPTPVSQMHLRPGGKTEEFVHWDTAAERYREISALKAFVGASNRHERREQLEVEATADDDFDEGFELSF